MDEENPPPSRPYRIRRASSSLISSTTSPMFSAPAAPQLQPPPSPMAHHSRHRPNNSNNNGAISQNASNNNFGPGDIDDDVQPSSSSSSFPPPSPRPRVGGSIAAAAAGSSSSFNRNSGPQSPLSSPDSTFWGGAAPSPSPVSHSYRGGPSTPGGMCVVSSSTVDDVPPSPFSPAEDISNSGGGSNSVSNANNNGSNSANLNSVSNLLSNSLMGPVAGPSHSGSGSSAGSSNGGSLSLVHHRISQLIVGNSGNNPSVSVERHNNSQHQQQHSALISQLNQEVNHGESSHASTSSASSSHSSSLAFNISPLRNKIKKASSFERFSQAQAASSGSRSSGVSAAIASNDSIAGPSGVSASSIISNQNSTNSNEQPISLPLAASANSASSTPSASSAIVSRISWEPVATAASTPSTSQSSTSSFRLSQNASFGDKSHIKIPSKKLAAKIASVFEQEQLNEAAMASASATVTNVIIPSTSTGGGMSNLSHHHQGTSSSSSPIVQSYLNSSSSSQSQSNTGSNSNANSTLSQILNEAPAHHLSMGSLVSAAEEQIMSQGGIHGVGVAVSSHENLIRELNESPLNLAESSNSTSNNSNNNNNSSHHHSNHHHSHSQSQSILPHRNPVISSRASLSNSSSSASTSGSSSSVSNNSSSTSVPTFLSKKIPLTPKQKLLHRIQSGTMSPPIEPQPPPQQQQQHQQQQQQQVLSIHHQMQQVGSPPQSLQQQLSQQLQQQQASISSALSSIQSSSLQSANLSLVQEQLQHASNGNGSGGHHLILSSGGPHSPNSQLDAYSYEAMLRQREDLAVQEAIGKIIDDPNNVNNMPYDAPEAYAYYQSILSDDIFPSGNSSQSRSMQQQMSGNLQDPNDSLQQSQHQGQIEFVLGLPGADEHDRNRADDLSLGNDGGQQQFLDPNDALAVIKSHNQTDSTLRNLLMMDPSRHTEDAWLLAEYQNPNRLLTTDFNNRSSTIRNGMVGGSGSNGGTIGINSTSVLSINGIPTSIGTTSWNNDSSWQRASLSTTTWQHQAPGDVSVDQDEVMDMSMMEPDKPNSGGGGGSNSGSNSIVVAKRISQLHAAYGDQSMDDVNLVSDRDLANGLPLLQNMPISMPMDLQQPLGLLQSSNSSANSLKNALNSMNGIPMDLQHHKILSAASGGSPMDMDDQPVNLMAVNLEQELSHHSNSSGSMSHHHHAHQQQQHSAAHLLPHHLAEVKSLSHSSGNGNDHSSQQNGGGSYTIQMHQQSQHIPNEFQQQHHSQHQQQLVEVGDLSPVLDNIDERRVIRVKKNKDNMPLCQDDPSSGFPPPNFIPDKPVQPKSYASLPSPLQLVKVGNGDEIAVFTRNKSIPPNTRFGPVEGSLKKACASDMDTMNAIYPCLILTDHNNILWRVNRDDDDCCNWMKFVRMAHSIRDQNALVSDGDHDGLLYFTTCKEIPPRTELQVGFSFEYAQKYGLPYLLPMPNSSSAHNSNNSINSGMLDDEEKMTISSMQQQSNAIATVIQGGSQNFLSQHQQQHQQLQKSIEDSMLQNHHDEELQQHEEHHEHELHHHHQQQHHQQSHTSQSTSSSPETTSSVLQQPQQKSVIVESFPCFECPQEFHDHSSLQQHLDKMHKEPEIRRPKKKAIKKYQQSQQSQQNSAVSTTAHQNNSGNSSVVTTGGGEVMDVSFSFSTSSSTTSERISDVGAAVVAKAVSSDQSGKVDSSSQSNAVDSSDPLAMGNLPMTKKRKAASSINAMNAKSLSSSASSASASSYSLGSGVAATTMSNSSINSRNDGDVGPTPAESLEPDTVVSNSVGGNVIGGSNIKSSNNTKNSGGAMASGGGVSGGIMNTSVNSNNGNGVQQVDGNDSDVTASQPPAKVKCTMCYKSFATKERLDRHMIVHSDEDTKPLKCPFCPKRFLTNSALAGHIKTHAEEGKCFECPMCNFSTPQLLQLKEHVQTHKNRDSGMFHCPQCPKKFSAYSMIRKHIRAFHGPRQYECEQCPMCFPTADKLKLHKLKHSDHREFLCAECGRQFKRKDKLREHTKRIHETKRKAIELTLPKDKHNMKKFIPKVSPEEYERFIYKCSECMVGFKRRGMLVNHLAKRHPEKPPQQVPELNMPIVRPTRNYFCLYCERVYKSSSKRKAHIIKAHPGKAIPPQARCKDIPTQLASFIDPQPLQPGTIVQTLTDDGNNTARAGVVSSAVSSTRLGSNAVSTSALAAAVRRETVVGKVVAQPHGCQWCHRQYATRAKLLQHQRKAHIHLMPADMQMPRTQKNNVMRKEESSSKSKSGSKSFSSEQDSVISSNVTMKSEYPSSRTSSKPVSSSNVHSTRAVTQSSSSNAIVSSSGGSSQSSIVSTPVTTTTTTLQALQAEGLPFQTEEGGLVGILVTPVGSNVELGNLVQGDVPIVMLATQAVNGSSATASALSALQGVNFSVLQAGQVTNLSSSNSSSSNNNGTNASPNIISISNTSTTGNSLDSSSPGNIITINTGSGNSSNSNSSSVARIANVIQHHQSSSSNSNHTSNSDNNNGNNGSSTSSSSGVISATGKL